MDKPSRTSTATTVRAMVPFVSGESQSEVFEGELVFDHADPYAVTMHLEARSGSVVWTFARELLATASTSRPATATCRSGPA